MLRCANQSPPHNFAVPTAQPWRHLQPKPGKSKAPRHLSSNIRGGRVILFCCFQKGAVAAVAPAIQLAHARSNMQLHAL